ncbi:hypothetical protein Ciccas_000046 [Cichlidogyrus casuarinus]|uniref:Ion transport domain-containing protein n=1 Tax=Cichlidogyrus casuarinus TaxID=1844966 RepID=A0ABD2QPA7_9PLAT
MTFASLKQKKAQLIEYCVEGNLEDMRKFRKDNPADEEMVLKSNCAHQAAGYGHIEILEYLVKEFGADKIVNKTDSNGWKPIQYAVRRKINKMSNDDLELFGTKIKGLIGDSLDTEIIEKMDDPDFSFHPTLKYLMQTMIHVTQPEDHTKLETDFVNALKRAIGHNNFDAVLEIIKHFYKGNNADLSKILENKDESENGWTLLHMAAFHGFEEIVEALLYYGAGICPMDNKKWTPFHHAVSEGHLRVVRGLMNYAQDNRIQDVLKGSTESSYTPIHLAIINGHCEIVKYLLDEGVELPLVKNHDDTCLHLACQSNDVQLFNLIFDKDETALNKRNRLGQSPLHNAAIYDCDVIAEQLIEKGANLEIRDYKKQTPLFLAMEFHSTKTLQKLLKNEASFRTMDISMKTCIFVAVEKNRPQALKILLDKSLQTEDFSTLVNQGDSNNCTPLHIAAGNGGIEAVKLLLESKKINTLAREYQGKTALHLAAQNGHLKVMEMLLDNTPRLLDKPDINYDTALHKAAQAGHVSVVEFLLQKKSKFTKRNKSNRSALDLAARNGHLDVIPIIVMQINNKYDSDTTREILSIALRSACEKNQGDAVKLLIKMGADPSSNSLEVALDNYARDAVEAILLSEKWKSALMTRESRYYDTPLRKIIREMPDLAIIVFDRSVEIKNGIIDITHDDFECTYHLDLIEDTFTEWSLDIHHKNQSKSIKQYPKLRANIRQLLNSLYGEDTAIKTELPYHSDSSLIYNNHILSVICKHKRKDLIHHKVVKTLVKYKWLTVGLPTFLFNLILYVLFLGLLTLYMINRIPPYMLSYNETTAKFDSYEMTCNRLLNENKSTCYNACGGASGILLVTMCIIHLAKEFYQLICARKRYINLENIMELFLYVSSILLVYDFDQCNGLRKDWQWQMGTVTIFVAWMNLILFIRKFSSYGAYTILFFRIFERFLSYILLYSLFIFSFGIAFYALLRNQLAFSSLGEALMKTSVMTIGEMDFATVFYNRFSEDIPLPIENQVPYVGLTYLFWIVFLILMCIIFINMMIAMTVDDMNEVQRDIEFCRLRMQSSFSLKMEQFLPQQFLQYFLKTSFTWKPNTKFRYFSLNSLLKHLYPPAPDSQLLYRILSMDKSSDFQKLQYLKPENASEEH